MSTSTSHWRLAACEPEGGSPSTTTGTPGVQVADVSHPFGVTEAVDEFVALTGANGPEVVDSLAVLRVPSDDAELDAWRAALERFAQAST